ncbi:MAG: hypothetical protein ACYDEQ_04665 [Desulfocucumaceae bacterium]
MFSLDPYMGDLKNQDGWLEPNGDFYACSYEKHWQFADEICKKYKYRLMARFLFNLDAEYTLEVNGWVKISLGKAYYHREKPLTKKQADFLFDYYLANEQNILEYRRIIFQNV